MGHAAHMREIRNVYTILVGKPQEKIPLERLGRRWKDHFKMALKEIMCM
jgi:hypothetical protein